MNDVNSRQIVDEMLLRQIGADVLSLKGVNTFVRFDVNGQKVNYLFNINHKNSYYLQRISPYQMPLGIYDNAEDVVTAISDDYNRFKITFSKERFEVLIQLNKCFLEARQKLEDQFINEDVDAEFLEKIKQKLKEL